MNIVFHSFQEVMGIFKYLRNNGWRGTFMCNRYWVMILGTYQFDRSPDNDN